MKLLDSLISPGENLYYTAAFRNMIEDHLSWLKSHPENFQLNVEPGIAYKFAGDFDGVLRHHKVSQQYIWINMRMNGLTSPSDYREHHTTLVLANPNAVETLRSTFLAQSKIKK